MKRIYSIIIILILPFANNIFSQTHLIVDADTKQAIPFVALSYLNSNDGSYSNETGYFLLVDTSKDSIQLSCLGYKTTIKAIKTLKDTILLQAESIKLSEIIIKPKKLKFKIIGYSKKNKKLSFHLRNLSELAILLQPLKEYDNNIIQSIQIPIKKSRVERIDGKWKRVEKNFKSAFRLNLYIPDGDNKQTISLFKRPIIVYCTHNSKDIISIDISDKNIEFTKAGLFIRIQMIGEIDSKGQTVNKLNPSPAFMFTSKKSRVLYSEQYYRNNANSKWTKLKGLLMHLNKDYNLAIGLVLGI